MVAGIVGGWLAIMAVRPVEAGPRVAEKSGRSGRRWRLRILSPAWRLPWPHGLLVDVIAESWALAGDSSAARRRPRTGDRVICEGGVLATVVDASGEEGDVQVVADGKLRTKSWWAIVLPGI